MSGQNGARDLDKTLHCARVRLQVIIFHVDESKHLGSITITQHGAFVRKSEAHVALCFFIVRLNDQMVESVPTRAGLDSADRVDIDRLATGNGKVWHGADVEKGHGVVSSFKFKFTKWNAYSCQAMLATHIGTGT